MQTSARRERCIAEVPESQLLRSASSLKADCGVQPLDVNYDTKIIVDRIRNQSSRYQHSNSLATDKTPLVCVY